MKCSLKWNNYVVFPDLLLKKIVTITDPVTKIESHIREHSEVQPSHSIFPALLQSYILIQEYPGQGYLTGAPHLYQLCNINPVRYIVLTHLLPIHLTSRTSTFVVIMVRYEQEARSKDQFITKL